MNEHADGASIDAAYLEQSFDLGQAWTKESAWKRMGWKDRRLRLAVAALRQRGYPVISTSGAGSVYRKAHTRDEVDQFIERELKSRARALEEQIREMRRACDSYFGSPQLALGLGSTAVSEKEGLKWPAATASGRS